MKEIRYWIGKVLAPEQTVEKTPEPKHSTSEQIKFYQKQQQEETTPKTRKQNMER